MAKQLRDYQKAAVQALFNAYNWGKRKVVVSLPTAGGKTFVAGKFLQEFRSSPHQHFLFAVPRIDLVIQTKESFIEAGFFKEEEVGIIQGDTKEYGRMMTIACIPTLRKPQVLADYLASIGPNGCDAVFIDECQIYGYESIIAQCLNAYSILVGLSATPYRADTQSLKVHFPDGIVYVEEIWKLITDGWLSNITSYDVKAHLPSIIEDNISPFMRKVQGLSITREQTYRYAKIYTEWLDKTVEYEVVHSPGEEIEQVPMKRTLVFCQSIKDAYAFQKYLLAQEHTAEVITGETKIWKRQEYIRRFKAGELTFLLNYEVMTTGTDIPHVECLIMMRDIKNLGLWTQCIGRGLRPCAEIGKEKVIILNCVENEYTLVMFHQLFGVTTSAIKSLREVLKKKREKEEKQEAEFTKVYVLDERIEANATESSLFHGGHWKCDPVTQSWELVWGLNGEHYVLHAVRMMEGCYQPLVTLPDGEEHVISAQWLTKFEALAACQGHVAAVREGQYDIRGRDPNQMKQPITVKQFQHLVNKKTQLHAYGYSDTKGRMSEAEKQALLSEMTQGDYLKIADWMKKHGNSPYSKDDGNIGYYGSDNGVTIWGNYKEYRKTKSKKAKANS